MIKHLMHLQKRRFESVTRGFKSLLASFCKWDSYPSCEDSNHSRVLHISRFLDSNHYVEDSNPTSLLSSLVLFTKQIEFVDTLHQLADIFTKPLDKDRFCTIKGELGMMNAPWLSWCLFFGLFLKVISFGILNVKVLLGWANS